MWSTRWAGLLAWSCAVTFVLIGRGTTAFALRGPSYGLYRSYGSYTATGYITQQNFWTDDCSGVSFARAWTTGRCVYQPAVGDSYLYNGTTCSSGGDVEQFHGTTCDGVPFATTKLPAGAGAYAPGCRPASDPFVSRQYVCSDTPQDLKPTCECTECSTCKACIIGCGTDNSVQSGWWNPTVQACGISPGKGFIISLGVGSCPGIRPNTASPNASASSMHRKLSRSEF